MTGDGGRVARYRAIAAAGEADGASLGALVPWIADRPALAGRPTAYVCVHGRCDLPVHDIDASAAGALEGRQHTGDLLGSASASLSA